MSPSQNIFNFDDDEHVSLINGDGSADEESTCGEKVIISTFTFFFLSVLYFISSYQSPGVS